MRLESSIPLQEAMCCAFHRLLIPSPIRQALRVRRDIPNSFLALKVHKALKELVEFKAPMEHKELLDLQESKG
jgi:hypothetical protein